MEGVIFIFNACIAESWERVCTSSIMITSLGFLLLRLKILLLFFVTSTCSFNNCSLFELFWTCLGFCFLASSFTGLILLSILTLFVSLFLFCPSIYTKETQETSKRIPRIVKIFFLVLKYFLDFLPVLFFVDIFLAEIFFFGVDFLGLVANIIH